MCRSARNWAFQRGIKRGRGYETGRIECTVLEGCKEAHAAGVITAFQKITSQVKCPDDLAQPVTMSKLLGRKRYISWKADFWVRRPYRKN